MAVPSAWNTQSKLPSIAAIRRVNSAVHSPGGVPFLSGPRHREADSVSELIFVHDFLVGRPHGVACVCTYTVLNPLLFPCVLWVLIQQCHTYQPLVNHWACLKLTGF